MIYGKDKLSFEHAKCSLLTKEKLDNELVAGGRLYEHASSLIVRDKQQVQESKSKRYAGLSRSTKIKFAIIVRRRVTLR